jgi:surface antigen
VKNLTVVLKSLILMATLGSVVGCSTVTPYQSESVRRPAVGVTHTTSGIVNAVSVMVTNVQFGLSDTQKEKQNAAVYTALNSEYGQVIQWYERDAMGAVKAVHGYPQGSGYCKVIYSMITVKGRSRHFEETACTGAGHQGWRFVTKYR